MHLLLLLLLLLAFASPTSAFSPSPARFWFLNEYLNYKTIGRYNTDSLPGFIGLGPCPDNGRKCIIDVTALPADIKAIGLQLPSPFNSTITLGQAIPTGLIFLYWLQIQNIEFEDVKLVGSSMPLSSKKLQLVVKNVKFGAKTFTQLSQFQIPNVIGLGTITSDVTLNKALQNLGTNLTIDIVFTPPPGRTLANSLPNNVSLPFCSMGTDLGLQISNVVTLFPFTNSQQVFGSLIANIAGPLLGDAICGVLKQLFITVGGTQGFIARKVEEYFQKIGNLSGRAEPVAVVEDLALYNSLTSAQRNKTVFFKDNVVVKGLATVLNNWLGQGNPTNPLVNEVVNLLTMPNNGTANFYDLNALGLEFTIRTAITNISISMRNLTLTGLNTFGDPVNSFKLLDNPSDLFYTLENYIYLNNIGISFSAFITLIDNPGYDYAGDVDWIYVTYPINPASQPTKSFNLKYSLGLQNLDVAAFLAIANAPSELKLLQLGQILGKSGNATTFGAQAVQAGKCASRSMYGFSIPSLRIALGSIITPVFSMIPNDVGLSSLINNATTAILDIVQAAVQLNFGDITQHWIRPVINDLAEANLVAGGVLASCELYYSQGKTTPNLLTSKIFSSAKKLISTVVGGNPVASTSVSINQLLQQVILFIIQATGSSGVSPSPGRWAFKPSFVAGPGQSFIDVAKLSTIQIGYAELFGLNSIYKLTLDNIPNTPQGLILRLSLGKSGNPVGLKWTNFWRVNYDAGQFPLKYRTEEAFNVSVGIEGLAIEIGLTFDLDLDRIYQLLVFDVANTACWGVALLSANLNLNVSTSAVLVSVTQVSSGISQPANALRLALTTLASATSASSAALSNIVNYILHSIGLALANGVGLGGDPAITVSNCAAQPTFFNSTLYLVVLQVLSANLTETIATGTGPQPAVRNASLLDAEVLTPFGSTLYNLKTSLIVPAINNAVTGLGASNFRRILQDFGNGTGDVISDILTTNKQDGSVGLDVDFSMFTTTATPFSLGFLITNASLLLRSLSFSNLTNLDMATIRVVKPISKYVTETYLSLPGKQRLAFLATLILPNALTSPGALGTTSLNISFSLDLDNLLIDIQALTALDTKKLNGLTLGSFISVDASQRFSLNTNFLACVFNLFVSNGLNLPKLMISANFGQPVLSLTPSNVIVSSSVVSTLNAMLGVLTDFYGRDLKDVTQGFVRTFINDFFLRPRLEDPTQCPDALPPPLTGAMRVLNFKQSPSVARINHASQGFLAGTDHSYRLVNSVINLAIGSQVFFDHPANSLQVNNLSIVYKKQSMGNISVAFGDLEISGLGTFSNMNLLEARTNTSIYNNITIAGPLIVEFTLRWNLKDLWDRPAIAETGLLNELHFKLTMVNVTLGALLDVSVDVPDLLLVRSGSLTNLTQSSCLLTAVSRLSLSNFVFDVDHIETELTCAGSCQSPLINGLEGGGSISSGSSNSLANYIPIGIQVITNFLNSPTFGSSTNTAVGNAAENCAASLDLTTAIAIFNAPEQENYDVAVVFGLALLGFGAGFCVLLPLAVPRHYQLKDKMLAENLQIANAQPGANAQSVARFMAKAERDQVALGFHPALSLCCLITVPSIALMNVILLALSFIVYLSFSVDTRLTVLGEVSRKIVLVPWTISSTINNMWNSGAWPLAVLIVFASCFWPVVKNLALFYIWYAPLTFLSHKKRTYYLIQLDVLGKWSFLDVYIIVLLVGALKFLLILSDSPSLQILPIPQQLLIVDVIITPGIGIVMLCLAAMMSLVVNHIIIWLMRHAEWADRRLFKQIDGEQDDMLSPKAHIRLSISEYVFSTSDPQGQRDRYGPRAKNSVILMIAVTSVVLIAGMVVPYFSMSYDGVLGIAIGFFVQGGRTRTFSLLSIGLLLSTGSDGTVGSSLLFLYFQVLYFLSVIVAPFVQLWLHLFLWLRPMGIMDARNTIFFCRVAAYWASIEVFCVAIIALTIEVKAVTKFLLDFVSGGACTASQPLFQSLVGEDDKECLTPGASLQWGFPVSFAANILQIAVGAIMLRANEVAIRDREDILERRPHEEWTWAEYYVLRYLLVNGAEHHKPQEHAAAKKPLVFRVLEDFSADPKGCCKKCGSDSCSSLNSLNCCSGLCNGVQDVSLMAPVVQKSGQVGNSKWNAGPSSPQASNKWNQGPSSAQPSGKWNAGSSQQVSNRWNASSQPASPQSSWNMAPPQSMVASQPSYDSANPVFYKEQQNKQHYSVDV